MTENSQRIARFCAASRARAEASRTGPRQARLSAAFFGRYARLPFWERYARSMGAALEEQPVYLFDDEHLVGMLYQSSPGDSPPDPDAARWAPYSAWEQMRLRQEREIEPYLRVGGGPGHIGFHWEWILQRGIEGEMALLRERLAAAPDVRARRLCRGALILYRSILRWNQRHVQALREAAGLAQGAARARLEQLVAVCERVPRYPARSFHEAVQGFYMLLLAKVFENPYCADAGGQLDVLLWPWLERDLQRGAITLERARELIDELFVRNEERVHHADLCGETITCAGTHPDGSSSVNPLSYILVESIMALEQAHPYVYMRLARNSPPEWVALAARYALQGRNRAQIYNDEACLPAIIGGGVAPADAAHYMAGGCMEISPQGTTCDLNFTCTHNVAKTLELVLNGGVDLLTGQRRIAYSRTLADYADFEALYAAFENELTREYAELVRALDIASECYARYRPCYLLSSLTEDCVARGRDIQDGGARYHDYGFSPLGITSAADALNAIRQAVYQQGAVSAQELLAALRANYVGHEALRARLASIPRFGVQDDAADTLCDRVLQTVCAACSAQRTRFGGRLKPMVFNFVWTPSASRELGARADGTPAGELIGHGLTPRSVAMTRGITAAMNSTLSLHTAGITGGATTMWDMDEQWITPELMQALLGRFVAGGGMIYQGNTTSVRELECAYEHPERYPNLIVRVGGFSARFTALSRDVQHEIIVRRRHAG
jgi:formate C-acetyltransferase